MANIYTSDFLIPDNNLVEIEITQINLSNIKLEVKKYSASNELIGNVNPSISYIENGGCSEGKTRVRLYFNDSQVNINEKVKFAVDN